MSNPLETPQIELLDSFSLTPSSRKESPSPSPSGDSFVSADSATILDPFTDQVRDVNVPPIGTSLGYRPRSSSLISNLHNSWERHFPQHFQSSVDARFTSSDIDYGLLDDIITETLDSTSKWRNADEEGILEDDLQSIEHQITIKYDNQSNDSLLDNTDGESYPLMNLIPNPQELVLSAQPSVEARSVTRTRRYVHLITVPTQPQRSRLYELLHKAQINCDNVSGSHRNRNILVGNSFALFPPDLKFRRVCFYLGTCEQTSCLMSFIILLELILLSFQMWNPQKTGYVKNEGYIWIDYVLIVTNIVYGIVIILRAIASGLLTTSDIKHIRDLHIITYFMDKGFFDREKENKKHKDPNICEPYLKNIGNVVDLVGFISFVISTCLGLTGWELKGIIDNRFLLFRSIMCVKILRITNLTVGTRKIKVAIYKSLPTLIKLGFVLGVVIVWFALVAVQSFSQNYRSQCIYMNHETGVIKYSNHLCGGFITSNNTVSGPVIGSEYFLNPTIATDSKYYTDLLENPTHFNKTGLGPKGFICPRSSYCMFSYNANFGNMSFNDLWLSLQIMVIALGKGSFSDQMYSLTDTSSIFYASLLFIPAIIVIGVWLVNVFVACILDTLSFYEDERNSDDTHNNRIGKYYLIVYARRSFPEISVDYICATIIFVQLIIDSIELPDRPSAIIINAIASGFLLFDAIFKIIFSEDYLKFRMNWAEISLAMINAVILLPGIRSHKEVYNWLTAFQIFRIYRIMLLITPLRQLYVRLLGNISYLINLFAFVILLFYSVAVIYSRFFEGIIVEDGDVTRGICSLSTVCTMSSLPNTILLLYVIMTGDNWTGPWIIAYTQIYHKAIRALIFLYISGWFFFATLLLVNIFLDLISENISKVTEQEKKWYQVVNFFTNALSEGSRGQEQMAIVDRLKFYEYEKLNFDQAKLQVILDTNLTLTEFLSHHKYNMTIFAEFKVKVLYFLSRKFRGSSLITFLNIIYLYKTRLFESNGKFTKRLLFFSNMPSFLSLNPNYERTLFYFTPANKLRRFIETFVPNFHGQRKEDRVKRSQTETVWSSYIWTFFFESFMLVIIIMMIVTTCVFTPAYEFEHYQPGKWSKSTKFDLFYCIIFSIEFILRSIADGIFLTPTATLMNKWGIITFLNLVSMWIGLIVEIFDNKHASSYITGIKAIRALRILTINKLTRDTFNSTFITSLQSILTAGFTSMAMIFAFCILGFHIFSQRLDVCNDNDKGATNCVGDYINNQVMCPFGKADNYCGWNVLSPRVYESPPLSFDTFFSSLDTLFQITSVDGWTNLLVSTMQSTGIGSAPTHPRMVFNALFVIVYNIVSMLIISNLFLSQIIESYSRETGTAYLSEYQLGWRGCKNIIMSVKPAIAYNPHFRVYETFETFLFDMFVQPTRYAKLFHWVLHIALATVLMYEEITKAGKYAQAIVIAIVSFYLAIRYCVICVVGSTGTGFHSIRRYGTAVLSLFAFTVSIVNCLGLKDKQVESEWITKLKLYDDPWYRVVQKVLVCFFFLSLIEMTPRLNTFLRFSFTACKQFLSLMLLWFVLFVIFAIALNQSFGLTKLGSYTTHNKNFRTIPHALLVLFSTSFGEGWGSIMTDFYNENETSCSFDSNGFSDCGNKAAAKVIFMSWNVISMYFLMNIFVSVIIEAFKLTYHDVNIKSTKLDLTVERFKKVWKQYDSRGTGLIPRKDLDNLIGDLKKYLVLLFDDLDFNGWIKRDFREEMIEKAIVHNKIHFHSTLLLACYYNHFAREKDCLRTFEDYIWRNYLDKDRYTVHFRDERKYYFDKSDRVRYRLGSLTEDEIIALARSKMEEELSG